MASPSDGIAAEPGASLRNTSGLLLGSLASQRLKPAMKVRWPWHLEVHRGSGDGMLEGERCGMKRLARCTAPVASFTANARAAIQRIAAKRVARFGEVNADLMGPARLQFAFHHRIVPETLDRANAGDRTLLRGILPSIRGLGPAKAIAPVANEDGIQGLCLGMPPHHRMVLSNDAMASEGLSERLCNTRSPGEDHQAAGVSIQAMNRYNLIPFDSRGLLPLAIAARFASIAVLGRAFRARRMEVSLESLRQQFLEGRLQLPTLVREIAFFKMTHTCNPRRLLDHNEKLIRENDPKILNSNRLGERLPPKLDHVAGRNLAQTIHAQVAIDLDPTPADRTSHITPTPVDETLFQYPFQDLAIVLVADVNAFESFFAALIHT
jgi:hypothetical protein